jgi:hypothetical protein
VQGKYCRRFVAGMVSYLLLLPLSLILLRSEFLAEPDTLLLKFLAALVAVLPALPFLLIVAALVGSVRAQDEFQQRVNLESVLITAVVTGGLTFSYGLLESAGLVPPVSLIFVAPFMILVWGAANFLVSRRYE